ncbi:MAG: hypothetical protein AAGI89_07860 [Pseudomonadota bacterium]
MTSPLKKLGLMLAGSTVPVWVSLLTGLVGVGSVSFTEYFFRRLEIKSEITRSLAVEYIQSETDVYQKILEFNQSFSAKGDASPVHRDQLVASLLRSRLAAENLKERLADDDQAAVDLVIDSVLEFQIVVVDLDSAVQHPQYRVAAANWVEATEGLRPFLSDGTG